MVVLPLVKLGTLALRSACRPITNRIKKEAGFHPKFRNFIITIAQRNHRLTTRIQRRIYSQSTHLAIRPFDEDKVVQAASYLIGELFLFIVAGAAIIFEVQRSSRAEARKEELRIKEVQVIKTRSDELSMEIKLLTQKVEELEKLDRGRGLSGILIFIRHAYAAEDKKA